MPRQKEPVHNLLVLLITTGILLFIHHGHFNGVITIVSKLFDTIHPHRISHIAFNFRLTRKQDFALPCSDALFFRVVKTAFQQRRKTLRNSLKSFGLSASLKEDSIFDERPERLGVSEFIELTQKIADDTLSTQ